MCRITNHLKELAREEERDFELVKLCRMLLSVLIKD